MRAESLGDAVKSSSRVSEHLLTFYRHDIGSEAFQMWAHLTASQRFRKVRSKRKPQGLKRFLYAIEPGAVSWYLLCISLGLDNLQYIPCLRMPLLGCWGFQMFEEPCKPACCLGARKGQC